MSFKRVGEAGGRAGVDPGILLIPAFGFIGFLIYSILYELYLLI